MQSSRTQAARVSAPPISAGPRLGFWVACATLAISGCAQQPPQRVAARQSSEYFPSAVYGAASPRVVSDGQAVPRGGGQYLVGRPYTIAGKRYYPSESGHESQVGMASYYGAAFHGRKTANGEVFDMASISAAHPTMPLPSYARVTNTSNGRSIVVRVNDRGPYHGGRVLDVSQRTADALDFRRSGTARVRVDYLGKAGLAGSDDNQLMATLRTDGAPASLDGRPVAAPSVMVASAAPFAPAAPRPRPEPPRGATTIVSAPRPDERPQTQTIVAEAPLVEAPAGRTIAARSNAPLPPSRPFDLGTIPGAAVPISAGLPPPRAAALFYAPDEKPARRGALARISRAKPAAD